MKILITTLWVLFVPIGIGIIVYRIRKSKLFGVFAVLLAIITCSSPCWTRKLFDWLGPVREALRLKTYTFLSFLFPLILIICPIIYILVIENRVKLRLKIEKILLTFIGTGLVALYSLYVSARKVEKGFDFLYQIFIERTRPLLDSITIVLTANAEGLEVLLLFLFAFLSGYLIYIPVNNLKFPKRFLMVSMIFIVWLIIVSINEAFIQRLWMPYREWDFLDIVHNMVGVLMGLVFSIGVFWKRQR